MNISVEEYTSLSPVTINLNASLEDASTSMKKNEIRHLPVLEDGKVVGVLSERDLIANYGKAWSGFLRVKDIMNTSILSVYAHENLGVVAYRLSREKKGSAVVLDENDSLYGIFTTTDALNALVELLTTDVDPSQLFKEYQDSERA